MSRKSWLTGENRRRILAHLAERDGAACHYCRQPFADDLGDATLNHYLPRRVWDEHRPRNLVLSCRTCSMRKSDALPVALALVLLGLVERDPAWRQACSGPVDGKLADRERLRRLLGDDGPGFRRSKPGLTIRKELPRLLLERDGRQCFYCRAPFTDELRWTLDHYVPHWLWPGWAPENIVLACGPCNEAKAGVLPPVMARLLLSLAA